MIPGNDPIVIRRILVAVDPAPINADVLKTAVQLASAFDAELIGIFVEDINLLRLAGLPFAREVTWSSAMDLRIDHQRMERTLRGHASYAQQAVISVTSHLKLHSSLQVVRGQVAQELIRAADNVDLLILGKGKEIGKVRIGHIALQVLRHANSSIMLVARDTSHQNTLMTISSRDADGTRIVQSAARLAYATDKTLLILIPAASQVEFERQREQIRQSLESGLSITYRCVNDMSACFNPHIIQEKSVGLLVIGGGQFSIDLVESQLAKLDCSVLLVR